MADEKCPYCSGSVDRTDKVCPHCTRSLTARALQENPPGGPDAVSAVVVGVPTSTTVLLILALLLGLFGLLSLSEATRGVGLICAGCLLAVWGRIFQAAGHHRDAARRR
jgi:hypothetical protein